MLPIILSIVVFVACGISLWMEHTMGIKNP